MIRSLLILLGILLLIFLAAASTHDAGQASLIWAHYRVDTSAAAILIFIGLLALAAVVFWNVALWLARSPQRAERKRLEARRRQGDEALTRGFMALAAGDGKEARRLAIKAAFSFSWVRRLITCSVASAASWERSSSRRAILMRSRCSSRSAAARKGRRKLSPIE